MRVDPDTPPIPNPALKSIPKNGASTGTPGKHAGTSTVLQRFR
jgi:hypothetical protein